MSHRPGVRAAIARAFTSSADNPPLAATFMIAALALLSLQDAIIKMTSDQVSIWQFQALRSSLNLGLIFLIVALFVGWRQLPPKHAGAVALRSLFLVGAMLCFFSGIPFLSLAEIAAGLYLYPLIIALLSRLVLGEPVGRARLAAIAVGLVGSLLILKPITETFQPVSLLPVAAAFFYASMVLTTRRFCRGEHPLTLATGVALSFLCVGLAGLAVFPPLASADAVAAAWPYLLTGWHPLEAILLLAVAACSLLNLTANVMLARAYQTAESSWLAPYDYTYLVFAALWGFILWGTVPDVLTLAGMVLIAAAGVFVATRPAPTAGPKLAVR